MLVESSLREGVFDDAQASKAIVEVKSARMLAGAVRCWTHCCISRLILTGLIEHYRRRLNSVRKPGTQEKGHATLEDTIGIREVLGAIPNEQAREQAKSAWKRPVSAARRNS